MRYFAYVDLNGKWHVNSLMSQEKIHLTYSRLNKNYEAFASIQNYDAKGTIQSCPLYIDVDSSSLFDAWQTTLDTWKRLTDDFNVPAYVYFSGSKGFHIVMPLLIRHEKCHLIARAIAEDYCVDLDRSVYTSRRMWRCKGSINRKTGNYKIWVPHPNWSLEDIIAFSEQGIKERHVSEGFKYHRSELFEQLVSEEIENINKKKKKAKPIKDEIVPFDSLDPCILKLWNQDDYAKGTRHNTLYLLARSCLKGGDSREEALTRFGAHPFWRDFPHVVKVVTSVYRAEFAHWSCHGKGVDADILTPNCIGKDCVWHKDFAFQPIDLNSEESRETIGRCSEIS